MNELGTRIARARKNAMLTQKELGEKLGCESITISRWERGVTTPGLRTLERISVVTKVPITEFVAKDGAPDLILTELKLLKEAVEDVKRELTLLKMRRRS